MGLSSPIALDQSFAAGQAFGTGGTPSAVLVDGEGKVASRLAVGAPDSLNERWLRPIARLPYSEQLVAVAERARLNAAAPEFVSGGGGDGRDV